MLLFYAQSLYYKGFKRSNIFFKMLLFVTTLLNSNKKCYYLVTFFFLKPFAVKE